MSSFSTQEKFRIQAQALGDFLPAAAVTAIAQYMEANPYTPVNQEVAYYRKLTGKKTTTPYGKWGIPFYTLGQSGKVPQYDDVLNAIKERKLVPTNRLEDVSVDAATWGALSDFNGEYTIVNHRVNYADWNSYLVDLMNDRTCSTYLSKLLLHEAAGLCIDGSMPQMQHTIQLPAAVNALLAVSKTSAVRRSGAGGYGWYDSDEPKKDPVTQLPYNIRLYDYKGSAPRFVKRGLQSWQYMSPYNPIIEGSGVGGVGVRDASQVMGHLGLATMRGYDSLKMQSFLTEVTRYQERILTVVLRESMFALEASRLEDEAVVTTVFQNFLSLYNEHLGMLNRTETVEVKFDDGKVVTKQYRFKDFSSPIPFTKADGTSFSMTLYDALRAQLDAAFWKGCWEFTKLKMASRVNQLGDPTAYIKKSPVGVAWQDDPWSNPFLAPDIKKTDLQNLPVYVNEASAKAVIDKADVINTFVRPQDVKAAPKVVQRYTRIIPMAGGGFMSPKETETAGNPLLLLATVAAGAAFLYFQSK